MLDIETFMNARTEHTVNINLSTESIHHDRGQIFRRIQNSQIRCSPCEKSRLETRLERPTRKKTFRHALKSNKCHCSLGRMIN